MNDATTTPGVDEEMSRLLEFLYVAPVGLIEFDADGQLRMANPRIAQLFNRFAPGGYFENFFDFLSDVLPELRQLITGFEPESGQICENRRFALEAPDAESDETLWFDFTVVRQERDRYIASVNNVTEQVRSEAEAHLKQQRLDSILKHVDDHIIFTVAADGRIDSWNRTGEYTLGLVPERARGTRVDEVLHFDETTTEALLELTSSRGWAEASVTFCDVRARQMTGTLTLAAIRQITGEAAGFSAILSRFAPLVTL